MPGPRSTSRQACRHVSGVTAISQTGEIKQGKVKCLAAGHAAQPRHGRGQTSAVWPPCPLLRLDHTLSHYFFLSSCKHASSLDLKLLSCFCKFIYHYTLIAEQKVSQCDAEPIGSVAFFCAMSCGIETLWCQLLARNLSIFVCNNMLFLYYAFIINWQHFQWFSYFLNNQICVIGNGTS